MLADKHRADFLLDFENHTFCNHGSYGAAPKVGALSRVFGQPDIWFFRWFVTGKMNYWWKWKVIPILGSGRFSYWYNYIFIGQSKLGLERQHYRVTLTAAKLLPILFTLHMKISQSSEIRHRKELWNFS